MKTHRIWRLFRALAFLMGDAGMVLLAFQAAYWTRFHSLSFLTHFPALKGIPPIELYHQGLWVVLPVWLLIFTSLGFYRESWAGAYDEFVQIVKGVGLAALITMAMSFSYREGDYSRLVLGLWSLYSILGVFMLHEIFNWALDHIASRWIGPRAVLVVGKGKAVEAIRDEANKDPLMEVHALDHIPQEKDLRQLIEKKRIRELVLLQGSLSRDVILETARLCETLFVECRVVPDLFEMRRGQIIMDRFLGLPTFDIKPLSLHGSDYVLKRSFDIVLSLLILSVLAIPLLLVSLLVRLDSPGRVLFSQDRMGLRGRKFKLYKFRTMIHDADAHLEKLKHRSDRSGPVFKMKNDPRITRVGKWLRAFSVDELPQIFNVLLGDMSLVGPRPQVLWEAAAYDDHARKRLRVMPGITGLWQVSGRAALSYEQMIDLDVFYVENWSLGLDLKILVRTLPAIFAKEGAY